MPLSEFELTSRPGPASRFDQLSPVELAAVLAIQAEQLVEDVRADLLPEAGSIREGRTEAQERWWALSQALYRAQEIATGLRDFLVIEGMPALLKGERVT